MAKAVHMIQSRILVVVLMLWGIAMIVPDFVRVARPLGSFGFYANNDGLIYDVTGPFPDEASSPAWRAGIRAGDRLDLLRLECEVDELTSCGNALALLGGLEFVLPGSSATLPLAATGSAPARDVTLIAVQRPSNFLIRVVVMLDQVAGILVVVAAGWLVWSRPSAMRWGFFLYANWFNPGQVYAFYAILQQWPLLLIAQDVAASIAEAAGYAGLLLFCLRVPNDKTEPEWRPMERLLPYVGLLLALALLASYGSIFGFLTESTTRAVILAGFAVDFWALAILLARRRNQTPEDYQRMRWVVWGCLIGLPSFLIAELASTTSIFETRWGDFTPTEDIIGLLYLVNGILCLFVFEALRRRRVVSVMIPLRRVTILGLTLSIPVLLLHREVEHLQEFLDLPGWAWVVVGAGAVFLISRLHEGAVHLADRYFNREVDQAERELAAAMLKARQPTDIDRLLADEPFRVLKLTSAAAFRRDGAVFHREVEGNGWSDDTTRTLRPDEPMLAPLAEGRPFSVAEADGDGLNLPPGLKRPVLAVPAVNPVRCFAVSLYGPHAAGTDLDANERALLARLSQNAAAMYAELESGELRRKVAKLEGELKAAPPASRKGVK